MPRIPDSLLRGQAFALALAVSAAFASLSVANELYFTDFDSFTAGNDQWVGTDGWLGISTGVGAHGIDDGIVPALGKTAFIGFNQPSSTFVTVLRPINYDPLANGTPKIRFESFLGIEDSTNGRRDSFFVSFYNIAGAFLASIRFANEDASFGIWRLDGTTQTDTAVDFINGELHLLFAEIDFSTNTWSADLDGIPLFTNATFNATGQTLNFGSAAAEWQLASAGVAGYGDNWMLVADWSIRSVSPGENPFRIREIDLNASNQPVLQWLGECGFNYQFYYSDDGMLTWKSDLPGSVFSGILVDGVLSYTDETAPVPSQRQFRVVRSEAP